MRSPTTPAGPAGLTLLAATAIAGIILAVHGWSGRHSGLAPGALGATASPASATTDPASPAHTAPPGPWQCWPAGWLAVRSPSSTGRLIAGREPGTAAQLPALRVLLI